MGGGVIFLSSVFGLSKFFFWQQLPSLATVLGTTTTTTTNGFKGDNYIHSSPTKKQLKEKKTVEFFWYQKTLLSKSHG